MANDVSLTNALIQSLFNHLTLPPRLPLKRDDDTSQLEHAVTERVINAAHTFRNAPGEALDEPSQARVNIILHALTKCAALHQNGLLAKEDIKNTFSSLDPDNIIILHLSAQNAGLTIRRSADGYRAIFEAFEVSPLAAAVLASKGPLEMHFPGRSVSMPWSRFSEASFQDNISLFLEQANSESIKRFAAVSHKASAKAFESRDTVDPALITQLLMSLLEANGNTEPSSILRKRVRDEVLWSDGAERPWRRMPFWLLLRVSLERHFCYLFGAEKGRVQYKYFICIVLAQLSDDVVRLSPTDPEMIDHLNKKLSRRLSKLELDKQRGSPDLRPTYEFLSTSFNALFHISLTQARRRIDDIWRDHKLSIKKRIPKLPPPALEQDMALRLKNSSTYLNEAMAAASRISTCEDFTTEGSGQPMKFASDDFNSRYILLAELEQGVGAFLATVEDSEKSPEDQCEAIATHIQHYSDTVNVAYVQDPAQSSIMILTVMELWMSMDKFALQAFGLLASYNPGIISEILDVLQVQTFDEMSRVRKIQAYVHDRQRLCNGSRTTVFGDPAPGCFGERFFDSSPHLQAKYEEIMAADMYAKAEKEKELRRLRQEYQDYIRATAETKCDSHRDMFEVMVHDEWKCKRCLLRRKADQMTIHTYESLLPADLLTSKAVVFELFCPSAFAAYRDSTWLVLGILACPQDHRRYLPAPKLSILECNELARFHERASHGVTLASTTKSFLSTHYSTVSIPAELEKVCFKNGLRLKMFDDQSQTWTGNTERKPTFAHHMSIQIPPRNPFASRLGSNNFAAGSPGPSSAEVVADQTNCPAGLNVHEYLATQNLFCGPFRFWPSLLVELAASNLNFSSEASAIIIPHLVAQIGPQDAENPTVLGIRHAWLHDTSFSSRLADQIHLRLDAISRNWRELDCMEICICLAQKLYSLFWCPESVTRSQGLIERARLISFEWLTKLRSEMHRIGTGLADRPHANGRFAFRAALLVRKTFALEEKEGLPCGSEALGVFFSAGLILQENLSSNRAPLTPREKAAMIEDTKLAHRMKESLQRSVIQSPHVLVNAIISVWSAGGQPIPEVTTKWHFLESPYDGWVQTEIELTPNNYPQVFQYKLLHGHLLVNGNPLSRLPEMYTKALADITGDHACPSFTSRLPGMSYRLASEIEGHQVHVGTRNGRTIIRATKVDHKTNQIHTLELIPDKVFVNGSKSDLPTPLIKDCKHWLNLNTGILEIRQKPDYWKSGQKKFWTIDMFSRQCSRRDDRLVSTQSMVSRAIMSIFAYFEDPNEICIWQKQKTGNLFVDLKRLELLFQVKQGVLHSREHAAHIDENQDAGTWYGLKGMLVLQDDKNPRQRSIIVPVPTSRLNHRRDRIHVGLDITPTGLYGKFNINPVLGRLECPAEPRLLFLKAELHAYTSFVIPDTLTGRTGTEEALSLLESGVCQPWSPIGADSYFSLTSMARLTPKRFYYPPGAKVMEQISWSHSLTTFIQHADFAQAIGGIIMQSEQLRTFYPDRKKPASLDSSGEDHLLGRYSYRQHMYHPSVSYPHQASSCTYTKYASRDRMSSSRACIQVAQAVRSVQDWSISISSENRFSTLLHDWPIIGGFDRTYDQVSLSDRISVDMPSELGSLIAFCRNLNQETEKSMLMFLVACLAFEETSDMYLIRMLIAFAINPRLKSLQPPPWPSYEKFRHNQIPRISYLVEMMMSCVEPYEADFRDEFGCFLSRKDRKKLDSQRRALADMVKDHCEKMAAHMLSQWPCPEPRKDGFEMLGAPLLIDIDSAMNLIRPEWLRLFQNFQLSRYISEVEAILDVDHQQKDVPVMIADDAICMENQEFLPTRPCEEDLPSLLELIMMSQIPPNFCVGSPRGAEKPINGTKGTSNQPHESMEIKELEDIIARSLSSDSKIRKSYARDLQASLDALKRVKIDYKPHDKPLDMDRLSYQICVAQMGAKVRLATLNAIYADDPRYQWLQHSDLWPRTKVLDLLAVLRSSFACDIGPSMNAALIDLGVSITVLQRLLRLEDASLQHHASRLAGEEANEGHMNWTPLEHPEWLLLEIDANFLIRPKQVDVAIATISPSSGQNSVLQMNMGEGKSSCIIPMVAASLADTTQLVRIIVPKALLQQMVPLLQSTLGGLLSRTIKHVPFSRRTPTSNDCIRTYYKLHTDLLISRGIILTLPEHILSFKLSGQQRMLDDRVAEAVPILRISDWFNKRCRDIMDESDFILAVRTQLIYPSGSQTAVDGHPHRWEAAELVLRLVQNSLWSLKDSLPDSIEIVQRAPNGLPFVYFLRKDAEDSLLKVLTEDICSGRTAVLPADDMTQSDKLAVKQFITQANPTESTLKQVKRLFPESPHLRKILYLLRGLFVHRILLMCLQKRWNVQYGLHPDRDPIAVPFHFKGVPSEQSEWGHPDVAIMLTALSFYYGGLTLKQFRQSLEHVLKSNDPAAEFDRWIVSSTTLPFSSRDWTQINLDDDLQCIDMWKHLRFNMDVIDHHMNHFVYPRHAKQFTAKLQTSGWDIPLSEITKTESVLPQEPQKPTSNLGVLSQHGLRRALTTGFSGTNDNRTMLPLNIRQDDLPGLLHTNAEVLTYLLLPRSRGYKLSANNVGMRLTELQLLYSLKHTGIRMLIDAGAQVLELDNESLVKTWLRVDSEARAGVYFSESNQAMVTYRSGRPVPLLASPFANDLRRCVVYLDEAHTRGTDLKMPSDARGALTLGPGLTKDSLVQAAMRLRQLATTQSVMFFAPPEVHQCILDVQNKPSDARLDSHDVICWLLHQTCSHIEQLQPLYYSQGTDYCRRTQASLDHTGMIYDCDERKSYLGIIRQIEKQSLGQLYLPKTKEKGSVAPTTFTSTDLKNFTNELAKRKKAFQDSGIAVHGSALQEVEQEREVAIEVETVREVQEPVHYTVLNFQGIHHDIVTFVTTGRLPAGSAAYDHAFSVMGQTSLGLKHGIAVSASHSRLFVSYEFPKTIRLVEGHLNDSFQRQVNWVLWNSRSQTALVVTPEEAECIIPMIRRLERPPTNLLTYSAPITKKMRHFNDLDFFAIPTLPDDWRAPRFLKRDLAIFAGSLYFGYQDYSELCAYLGIDKGVGISEEGEVAEKSQPFTAKPLTFLHEWLALKRKGQGFTHTPMGQICQGKWLPQSHPFFLDAETRSDYAHAESGTDSGRVQSTVSTSDSEPSDFEDGDSESDAGSSKDVGDDDFVVQ